MNDNLSTTSAPKGDFTFTSLPVRLQVLAAAVMTQNPGEQVTIVTQRPAKLRKEFRGVDLWKRSILKGRFVNYGAQKAVKEAHASGERQQQPNGWESLGRGLAMKPDGTLMVCFAPSKLKNQKNTSVWLLDGEEVPYEDIQHMLLASDKRKPSDAKVPDWFTPRAEHVVSIG